MNKYWSKEDEQFLIKNYPEKGIKFCALNLNKTNLSIERKAKRLKIVKNSPSLPWSKEDVEFLVNNYSSYGSKFCSKRLKRTNVSIINKVKQLKIKFHFKKYTKEECILICKKYNNYTEFYKNERQLYGFLFKMKWLGEMTSHMIRFKNRPIIWSKEDCINESLKYKTIKEWIKGSRSSYNAAHKYEWFEECSLNMIRLGSRQLRAIYSFEFENNYVYVGLTYSPEIRKKYHINNEKSPVYKHILKNKTFPKFRQLTDFLDKEIASKKEGEILNNYIDCGYNVLNKAKTGGLGGNRLIWDKNKCIVEAKKYNSRKEFILNNISAYGSARRNGWLEDCCIHMKSKLNNI